MASKALVKAAERAGTMRLFWRASLVLALAMAALMAAGLAHAQSWVRPAPPLVGYVGSSPSPQLCQRTYPLDEGCWLGTNAQRAIDKACALHGDVRGAKAALPGDKLFATEVDCATQRVGVVGQPFYCDNSGRTEAKYIDSRTGKAVFSCTPPPEAADLGKSMGCADCSHQATASGVNFAVGNAYRYETDFRSKANPLLELRRVYNSQDARPRAFGFNWTGSYERRLEIFDGLRVVAWRPDANMYYFDQKGGRFVADAGVKDRLVKVGGKSGAAWRYTGADGIVEEYDARGQLTAMRSASGDAVRLEYSADTGRVARVADARGRAIRFAYDEQGRVVRATDSEGGEHVYAYGGASGCRAPQSGAVPCVAGNLTTVGTPAGTQRTYYYDEASRTAIGSPRALTSVADATGMREVNWSYDLNGMVVGTSIDAGSRHIAAE